MSTTAEFEKKYAGLNKRQREAVDALDGPVMVIAGPGTGKTKILTLRIANILAKTDTPPEAILALTYTVNGAAEMQRRLAQIIGAAAYRVTITTFHGLCEQVIRDRPDRFPDLVQRQVAQAADRRRLMEELFRKAKYLKRLASFSDEPYYIGPCLQAIEILKREGVGPGRLGELVDVEEQAVRDAPDLHHASGAHKGKIKAAYAEALERLARLRELVRVYREYEKRLAASDRYDYADMVTRVADALEKDEDLRLSLQEHYQYLLVDEHQDTNRAQNRIVELLAGFFERPNLFIVGDEKQAIYRFQGASLENFMYFKDRFADVRLVVLTENYRSSQTILDAAQGVRASREPLISGVGLQARPIGRYPAGSPDAQWYGVARMIQKQLQEGQAADQVCVLYRRNTDGQEMAAMMAKLGVPYALETQLDVLDDPDIGRLLLVLDMVRQYGASGPLYQALHVPWLGVPPLDVYKLNAFCGRERNPYDVIASVRLMGDAHLAEPALLARLSTRLAGWHTLARQEDAGHALEVVVRESGCLDALVAHPQGQEKIAKLHAIYDIARSLVRGHRRTTLNDFVDHLTYIREKDIRLEASSARLPGRVRLMTAHAAKGLEFDVVYLVNAYDKHWPQPHRRSPLELPASVFRVRPAPADPDDPEGEERNLFYVALTRARHHAVIAWPEHDRQGKELTPSRFISLIDPVLTETVRTEELEAEYAANAQIRFAAPATAAPDLTDAEYLRDLFLRQGLSATALNNYLQCPWKYFYTSLIRIPEPPSVYLMYGTAVDRALERYFTARGQGTRPGVRDLLELFRQSAREQPFQEHELAAALAKGQAALKGWHARWHAAWPSGNLNQVRIQGIPVLGAPGATINGKLDKIELLGQGRVNVVDYKTGKPKSRAAIAGTTKSSDSNYLRQLTFYRTLLDQWQDGRHRMEAGIIDFVDPDDRGAYHKEPFIVSRQDASALMEQIAGVCRDILDLVFWNKRCSEKECRYCALRALMK